MILLTKEQQRKMNACFDHFYNRVLHYSDYDKLEKIESGKHIATLYTGEIPPKSYIDGLLGLSFLRNFNINMNFKEGALEIE
ncbi:MAG: hypothetical protein HY513_00715 [Candidatus Aenigmarchaeota archaeon]|nr:hypothetical protein [Candidatus Aenigmarchaeota archaeon]